MKIYKKVFKYYIENKTKEKPNLKIHRRILNIEIWKLNKYSKVKYFNCVFFNMIKDNNKVNNNF